MKIRSKLKRYTPKQIMTAAIIVALSEILLELCNAIPAGNSITFLIGAFIIAMIICEWVHPEKKE